MTVFPSTGLARQGLLGSPLGWALKSLGVTLLLSLPSGTAQGQDYLVPERRLIPDLQRRKDLALNQHQGAVLSLESLEEELVVALDSLTIGERNENEALVNRAFTRIQQVGPLIRDQRGVVQEAAQDLREKRRALLDGLYNLLGAYLALADTVSDPAGVDRLREDVGSTEGRISGLLAEEDPVEALDPEPEIVIAPTDLPTQIRAKARFLELRANQFEEQVATYGRQLEILQREQGLLRMGRDFIDGVGRFGDRPVGTSAGPPTETPDPLVLDSLGIEYPALTLEERIQALLLLQEELTERVSRIRAKAQNFRRRAGGEWA